MRNGKGGRYTQEFKQEAVRLVESGQNIAETSRSLGVVEQTLRALLGLLLEGEGYSLGKSCHRAPLRAIHRMPSSTLRLSAHGRPPRFPLRYLGRSGSIFFHCRSVNMGPPRGIGLPSCHVMAPFPVPLQVPDSIPNRVLKQLLGDYAPHTPCSQVPGTQDWFLPAAPSRRRGNSRFRAGLHFRFW